MLLPVRHTCSVASRFLAAGVLICAVVSSASPARADAESGGQTIDDATITAQIKTQLLADDVSRSSNIKVDTEQGQVTLSGTAPHEEAKFRAQEIAENIGGVAAVANNLVVGNPTGNPHTATARTADAMRAGADSVGSVVEDTWITTKVKAKLLADERVEGFDVQVSTRAGVTVLSGVLPSAAARDRAIALARQVAGVKRVDAQNLRSTES